MLICILFYFIGLFIDNQIASENLYSTHDTHNTHFKTSRDKGSSSLGRVVLIKSMTLRKSLI